MIRGNIMDNIENNIEDNIENITKSRSNFAPTFIDHDVLSDI